MFKMIIILLLCIACHCFTNKKIRNDLKIQKYETIFSDNYNCMKPTFTILSKYDITTDTLISKLKKHKINHVYVNIHLFEFNDIISICNYHMINTSVIYKEPLIFDEKYKYIGGITDLYKLI